MVVDIQKRCRCCAVTVRDHVIARWTQWSDPVGLKNDRDMKLSWCHVRLLFGPWVSQSFRCSAEERHFRWWIVSAGVPSSWPLLRYIPSLKLWQFNTGKYGKFMNKNSCSLKGISFSDRPIALFIAFEFRVQPKEHRQCWPHQVLLGVRFTKSLLGCKG